jgi:hypothetical protein
MFETESMEPTRVDLHNWPADHGPGAWIKPHGDPIAHWTVRAVHARYISPRVEAGALDAEGRRLKRRPELHAYLVDLDGDAPLGLPDLERALLYQVPPVGWWMLKTPDADYLGQIDKYRQT